jgi:hypothetical protein
MKGTECVAARQPQVTEELMGLGSAISDAEKAFDCLCAKLQSVVLARPEPVPTNTTTENVPRVVLAGNIHENAYRIIKLAALINMVENSIEL